MKVRFYVDIPSPGVRIHGSNPWILHASTQPSSVGIAGYTRVAFDVDMPPNLILPQQDVLAPSGPGAVIEEQV